MCTILELSGQTADTVILSCMDRSYYVNCTWTQSLSVLYYIIYTQVSLYIIVMNLYNTVNSECNSYIHVTMEIDEKITNNSKLRCRYYYYY